MELTLRFQSLTISHLLAHMIVEYCRQTLASSHSILRVLHPRIPLASHVSLTSLFLDVLKEIIPRKMSGAICIHVVHKVITQQPQDTRLPWGSSRKTHMPGQQLKLGSKVRKIAQDIGISKCSLYIKSIHSKFETRSQLLVMRCSEYPCFCSPSLMLDLPILERSWNTRVLCQLATATEVFSS